MRFQDFVAIVCQTLQKEGNPIETLLAPRESEMLLADCFMAGWKPDQTIDKILTDAREEGLIYDFWRD